MKVRGRATLARGKPTGRVESCDQWPEMWSADGACNRVRISRPILVFFYSSERDFETGRESSSSESSITKRFIQRGSVVRRNKRFDCDLRSKEVAEKMADGQQSFNYRFTITIDFMIDFSIFSSSRLFLYGRI